MELRRRLLRTEILDPRSGFERVELELEVRWDPLTGHSARLLPAVPLLRPPEFDLERLAAETQPQCPFCSDRIDETTPRLPPTVLPEGRIRRGEAVLFPNLVPYSQYSTVSVYSPARHFLPLGELTPHLVTDNLAAQVEFGRVVTRYDPQAAWVSVNANHMPPSGSSVFHPHLQGSVNPEPTTFQRLLAETPPARFREYVDEERRRGERYLGSTGNVEWLASFAPIGPAELRAFVFGVASPAELGPDLVAELGEGISEALGVYDALGFQTFNLAVYGAPPTSPGYPLNLRIVCRSNVELLYRSDVTWLERLHWEAAVDVSPEELAERAQGRFGARR